VGEERLFATWWMVNESPPMVAGEVIQPDGVVRDMTAVPVP
jgi:hypothetical protein